MKKAIVVSILTGTFILSSNLFGAEVAQDHFQIGARAGITLADGTPANDIMVAGIFGRYRLSDKWLVGGAFNYTAYDFEDPAKLLGVDASKVEDASMTEYIASAWIEREFNTDGKWLTPFVGAGLGLGFLDVGEASGTLNGGGTYNISSTTGVEIIPSILAGLRINLGKRPYSSKPCCMRIIGSQIGISLMMYPVLQHHWIIIRRGAEPLV